jgi:hypothetical protein
MTIFWVKSTIILSELAQILFLYLFKNKIIFYFVIFVATKRVGQQIFSSSSFVAVVGSGIRDPGSGMNNNQDPG